MFGAINSAVFNHVAINAEYSETSYIEASLVLVGDTVGSSGSVSVVCAVAFTQGFSTLYGLSSSSIAVAGNFSQGSNTTSSAATVSISSEGNLLDGVDTVSGTGAVEITAGLILTGGASNNEEINYFAINAGYTEVAFSASEAAQGGDTLVASIEAIDNNNVFYTQESNSVSSDGSVSISCEASIVPLGDGVSSEGEGAPTPGYVVTTQGEDTVIGVIRSGVALHAPSATVSGHPVLLTEASSSIWGASWGGAWGVSWGEFVQGVDSLVDHSGQGVIYSHAQSAGTVKHAMAGALSAQSQSAGVVKHVVAGSLSARAQNAPVVLHPVPGALTSHAQGASITRH